MSEIRTIIFDFYGTLVDIQTDEKKEEIFNYLSLYLKYYGAEIDPEDLKIYLEKGKERFLKSQNESYPELDFEIIFRDILKKEKILNPFLPESCCKLFRLLSLEYLQLFPDTVRVLKDMKREHYGLAIVSDAQKVFFYEEINRLGLTNFFDQIILSTEYGFKKPDNRLFTIAAALMNINPEKALYIGDSIRRDIEGAKKIGMKMILVRRQTEEINFEIKPDFCARSLSEAWEWVKDFSKSFK